MTIHGQTLGVFKRDNNQCIDTGATTTLTKIKIVVFLGVYGAMTRFSPRNTSLWRHYNVFHDEKRPLWLLVISYAINFLLVRCDWWLSIKVSIWARAWPHRNIFRIPWPVFRIPDSTSQASWFHKNTFPVFGFHRQKISTIVEFGFPYKWLWPREYIVTERKTPSLTLGMHEFHQSYF